VINDQPMSFFVPDVNVWKLCISC